jgi:hypothetical protein
MNAKARKTVLRAYWAWNNEKEERWLARMARDGWHLTAARGFFYRFEKGEPADVVYRMDYQSPGKFERKEYLGLFKDAGWEHVGEFGNMYYFRTKVGDGQAPEIHTDPESKIAMYRRMLGLFVIVTAVVWAPLMTSIGQDRHPHGLWHAIRGVQIATMFIMGYCAVRIALKIGRIKKNRRQQESK